MKKLLLVSLMFVASPNYAIGFGNAKATLLQNAAMKACDAQVKNAPQNMKEKTRKTCDCTVENTDYEAIVKNKKNGDKEKIKDDAAKVAKECSTYML